ncbi:MAG TPA: hypothetical protein VFP72_00915 [Kineosporiaceae bacterium]|nr:hypothetical protein [Kineosporiaceae bacterium]
MPRRLIPLIAAVVVAAAGLAGMVYGVLLATSLAPPATTTARLAPTGVPVVDTATGVLDLSGPRVRIEAVSPSGGPVFVGVGRADDVTAYLQDVSRSEVTRVAEDGTTTLARAGSKPSLPDPAGVDIWVAGNRGTGSAALDWPDTPGLYRVVVAADGSAPAPARITLLWAREHRTTAAPAVITVGALLLVGGLVGLIVLRGRRRPEPGEDAEETGDGPGAAPFRGPAPTADGPGQTADGPGQAAPGPGQTEDGPGQTEDGPGQTGAGPGPVEDETRLIRLRPGDTPDPAGTVPRPSAPAPDDPVTGPSAIPVDPHGPVTFSGGLPLAGRPGPDAPGTAPADDPEVPA